MDLGSCILMLNYRVVNISYHSIYGLILNAGVLDLIIFYLVVGKSFHFIFHFDSTAKVSGQLTRTLTIFLFSSFKGKQSLPKNKGFIRPSPKRLPNFELKMS